ncbi:MAG: hypothetical protein Q8S12_00290 [Hydrogenophaga sp.]|uniref:hypothetical protein n=1 Tax=Hydrogenophaga sp. TaxID=1904254 RepID=UPI0027366AAC|nr:hypothetical protein [Hydrogenophaga sp.]MDP3625004.1 hypothetical protein [Hydrogenophaga sp.]
MNPYAMLAAGALAVAATAGAFFYGQRIGAQGEIAKQAGIDAAVRDTREAAQQGAAAAIAALKPRNVTIRQELEREIQTNTVYRDCIVPAGGVRLANEALTGRPEPAGGVELPGAQPAVPKP